MRPRKYAKADIDRATYLDNHEYYPADEKEANLVTSRLETWVGNIHAPVLDIDVPHKLVPSSTEGHAHLYVDVECTWDDYVKFLEAAAKIGLLEDGFVRASIQRGFTSVRKEGVLKPKVEDKTPLEKLPWW